MLGQIDRALGSAIEPLVRTSIELTVARWSRHCGARASNGIGESVTPQTITVGVSRSGFDHIAGPIVRVSPDELLAAFTAPDDASRRRYAIVDRPGVSSDAVHPARS